MKLLLDTCVWGGAKTLLVAAGHDVLWTGDRDEDPGDLAILNEAFVGERVLVTLDKTLATWPYYGACRIMVFFEL